MFEQDDKPGSVVNDHLSRPDVATRLKRPTRRQTGRLMSPVGLASDGVYMCPVCYQTGGSLLHCLSTLACESSEPLPHPRFISVALSWESPPPAVSRHPAL